MLKMEVLFQGLILTFFVALSAQAKSCEQAIVHGLTPFALRGKGPIVEKLSSLLPPFRGLNLSYRDFLKTSQDLNVFDRILAIGNISYTFNPDGLMKIPRKGPVIFVVNHPTGIMDRALIGSLIHNHVRSDIKLMETNLLSGFQELLKFAILVNDRGRPNVRDMATKRANVDAINKIREHLGVPIKMNSRIQTSHTDQLNGSASHGQEPMEPGALIVFPADFVAYAPRFGKPVIEHEWEAGVFRRAQEAQATIVPIFIEAKNSILFSLVGHLHPILRSMRLGQEFRRQANQRIALTIGDPIYPEEFKKMGNTSEAAKLVRARTLRLENLRQLTRPNLLLGSDEPQAISADQITADMLERETKSLSPVRETDKYLFFVAKPAQIPKILLEIGRLREESFREVNEGFGYARDLSEYDFSPETYQLFVIDRSTRQLVGGARLSRGLRYVREGFKIPEDIFPDTTLEFSRLWMKDDYLFLSLFSAMGHFVGMNPEFTGLIGVPSFPSNLPEVQRQSALQVILKKMSAHPEWDKIQAQRPVLDQHFTTDIEDFDQLGTRFGKIIPPVFEAYAKWNAQLAGINEDLAFQTIDALVYLRLRDMPQSLLKRWMGKYFNEYANKHRWQTTRAPIRNSD